MSVDTRFDEYNQDADRAQCLGIAEDVTRLYPDGIGGQELEADSDIYFRAASDRGGLVNYILQECAADGSTETVFSQKDAAPLKNDHLTVGWSGLLDYMRQLEQRSLEQAANDFNTAFDRVMEGVKEVVPEVSIRIKQIQITDSGESDELLHVCLTDDTRNGRVRVVDVEVLSGPESEGENAVKIFATSTLNGGITEYAVQIPDSHAVAGLGQDEILSDRRSLTLKDFRFMQSVLSRFEEMV